jgi:uncharacterized protein (DUF983 family)
MVSFGVVPLRSKRPKLDARVAEPVSVVRRPGETAGAIVRTVFRFQCPHCGHGPVIRNWIGVHETCSGCGFRFSRDHDPLYFNGAIFVNYMLSGGLFVVSFFLTIMLTLPQVPWDTIAYAAPIGAIVSVLFFNPFSKVIWLTVDLRVRPVTEDELERRTP